MHYKRLNRAIAEMMDKTDKYEQLKAKAGSFCGNDEQGEFIVYPTEWDGEFVIACLSRNDFKEQGYDPTRLDDQTMQCIADDMGDNYVGEGNFWDTITDFCEQNNLPCLPQ